MWFQGTVPSYISSESLTRSNLIPTDFIATNESKNGMSYVTLSVRMETFWRAIIPGISNAALGFIISSSPNLKTLFPTRF